MSKNTTKYLEDVDSFHAKFGLIEKYNDKPGFLDPEFMRFRLRFLQEELTELANSCGFTVQGYGPGKIDFYHSPTSHNDLEGALDALVDLLYVLKGTVLFMGFGPIFDEAWDRVQAANMSKIRTAKKEDSKRGSSFDVVKPPEWKAPQFKDLLK